MFFYQLVKAQQDRDNDISALTQTMQSTYLTVLGSQNLKDDDVLQGVLDRILKQTVVCGFFIREYVSRRTSAGEDIRAICGGSSHFSPGSAIREAMSITDTAIAQYQDTFGRLRDEYLGRVSTYTAVVTQDIATTVHEISMFSCSVAIQP